MRMITDINKLINTQYLPFTKMSHNRQIIVFNVHKEQLLKVNTWLNQKQ